MPCCFKVKKQEAKRRIFVQQLQLGGGGNDDDDQTRGRGTSASSSQLFSLLRTTPWAARLIDNPWDSLLQKSRSINNTILFDLLPFTIGKGITVATITTSMSSTMLKEETRLPFNANGLNTSNLVRCQSPAKSFEVLFCLLSGADTDHRNNALIDAEIQRYS